MFLLKKILDVLKVDDKRFSVQINMYFGVFWTEERLKMPKTTNSSESSGWLPKYRTEVELNKGYQRMRN